MNPDYKILSKGFEITDTAANSGQQPVVWFNSKTFKYSSNGEHSHTIDYLPQLSKNENNQSSDGKFLNTFLIKDKGLAKLSNYVYKKFKAENIKDSKGLLSSEDPKNHNNKYPTRNVPKFGKVTKLSTISEVVNTKATINDKQSQLTKQILNDVNTIQGEIGNKQGHNGKYIFKHKYGKLLTEINNGSFGVVRIFGKEITDNNDIENAYYTYSDKGEIFYAVKEFKPKAPDVSLEAYNTSIKSEYAIGNSFFGKCSNIINVFDLMQLYDSKYIQVMELCPSGDLFNYIEACSKRHSQIHVLEADCFLKQVLNAVSFMHTHGIAHCDIKLENILLYPQGLIKLCDFGSSSLYQSAWKSDVHRQKDKLGTQPYLAPEEHLYEPYDARFSDCWSCGVVYMTMILGHYMWLKASLKDDVRYEKFVSELNNCERYYIFEELTHFYPMKEQLRKRALYQIFTPVPNGRISVIELLDTPWVRGIDCCQK